VACQPPPKRPPSLTVNLQSLQPNGGSKACSPNGGYICQLMQPSIVPHGTAPHQPMHKGCVSLAPAAYATAAEAGTRQRLNGPTTNIRCMPKHPHTGTPTNNTMQGTLSTQSSLCV
jgi:hypothetical protein